MQRGRIRMEMVRWTTAFTEKLLTSRTTNILCKPIRNCCSRHLIKYLVKLLPSGTFSKSSCAKPKPNRLWVAGPTQDTQDPRPLQQAEVRPISPSAQETGVFTKSHWRNTSDPNPNRYSPISLVNIPRSEHEMIFQSSSLKDCILWSWRG